MTAFVGTLAGLPAAEAVAGAQLSVSLGNAEEETHRGCNWAGCPAEIEAALAGLEGRVAGDDFAQLCVDLNLSRAAAGAP